MSKKFWTYLGWPLLVAPQVVYWTGAALNQIALSVNGGHMPVFSSECSDKPASVLDSSVHVCLTHATHLKFLCDWIREGGDILSVGDVFLFLASPCVAPLFWAWVTILVICAVTGRKFFLE